MIFLGLTGSLGSGKSTVASFFKEWGSVTYDADAIAKEILLQDDAIKQKIQRTFGKDIYTLNGELRKELLAERAFNSPSNQKKLNEIVHPAVRHYIYRLKEKNLKEKTKILLVEASMLFEAGFQNEFDAVIVVTASLSLRMERALKRGTLSQHQIKNRISLQMPDEEKIRHADYIIFNDGSLESLREKTKTLYQILLQKA
ncbi:MAG: dephospho-CoA kinase [Candidatus Marinimicrobia bacterium]|nr:dephospho-CoA kinase [Candidatus Neomarinimicrobiota bacterium]MDD5582033.1 dephospho-CoA kinase [Candidatus Neomarinimicrobiota bacterium]